VEIADAKKRSKCLELAPLTRIRFGGAVHQVAAFDNQGITIGAGIVKLRRPSPGSLRNRRRRVRPYSRIGTNQCRVLHSRKSTEASDKWDGTVWNVLCFLIGRLRGNQRIKKRRTSIPHRKARSCSEAAASWLRHQASFICPGADPSTRWHDCVNRTDG
jgi:hypothetical protein